MKFANIMIALCVLGLVIGVADVGGPMVSGVARALGAVFFILAFVAKMGNVLDTEKKQGH